MRPWLLLVPAALLAAGLLLLALRARRAHRRAGGRDRARGYIRGVLWGVNGGEPTPGPPPDDARRGMREAGRDAAA